MTTNRPAGKRRHGRRTTRPSTSTPSPTRSCRPSSRGCAPATSPSSRCAAPAGGCGCAATCGHGAGSPSAQAHAGARVGADERRRGRRRRPLAGRGLLQPGCAAWSWAAASRRVTRSAAWTCWASHQEVVAPIGGLVSAVAGRARPGRRVRAGARGDRPLDGALQAVGRGPGRGASRHSRPRAERRHDRPRPHRQPRRDRRAHPARLPQHGHRGRRGPQRGRPRLARRAHGRRGHLHRAGRIRALLPVRGGGHLGRAGQRLRRHPSRATASSPRTTPSRR